MGVSKNINIARGVFGTIAGLLGLCTIVLLGIQMDYANFPGSNLVLQTYGKTGSYVDLDREGQLVQHVDGFVLSTATDACANFRPIDVPTAAALCADIKDELPTPLVILDKEGNAATSGTAQGWIVAPPCLKTSNLADCSPFGYASPLSGLGAATFGFLAINALLFGVHTGVVISPSYAISALDYKSSAVFALNIVWTIISFSLFIWAALVWQGFCDKIDTGLGRTVSNTPGNQTTTEKGCATAYCTLSFSSMFLSLITAQCFYRIPNMLIFFGVLEKAATDDDDDDDDDDE